MAFCKIVKRKKRAFYVFDEHTDFVKECEKIGMRPIGNDGFVNSFEYTGTKYEVLSTYECFSGWEITVMKMPELSFSELLSLMTKSGCYDEIVGSIGIILKKYPDKFIKYLTLETSNSKKLLKIKKIIRTEISERNQCVKQMTKLLSLCQQPKV